MKDYYMGFQLATYLKLIPRRPLIHGDGVHKQCILRNIPTHLKWIKLTLTVLEENFPTHVTSPLDSEICLFFDRRFFLFFSVYVSYLPSYRFDKAFISNGTGTKFCFQSRSPVNQKCLTVPNKFSLETIFVGQQELLRLWPLVGVVLVDPIPPFTFSKEVGQRWRLWEGISKHLKGHSAPRVSNVTFFNQALWGSVLRSFGAPRE